jgi:hypothetical protein
LQAGNIDPFVQALAVRLQTVRPSAVQFDNNSSSSSSSRCRRGQLVELLHNDDRTRSFAVWRVDATTAASLHPLVEHCNAVLSTYQQPPYYDPPILHASLANFVPAAVPVDTMVDATTAAGTDTTTMSVSGACPCDTHSDDSDGDDDSSGDGSDSSSSSSDHGDLPLNWITAVHCKFGTAKICTIPIWSQTGDGCVHSLVAK